MTYFAIAALDPAQTKYLPIVVAIALFMQILDSTVLNTALPAMAHDLNQPALSMQWTVISYALTLAILPRLVVLLPISMGLNHLYGGDWRVYGRLDNVCGVTNAQ